MRLSGLVFATVCICVVPAFADNTEFPPGWLPIYRLNNTPTWAEFRKIDDRVHLYLPPNEKTVRGVFVCYVFHSQDPRQLADLWRFALVTIPAPFEYDLGFHDKRNTRAKLGHPLGNMGILLSYLNVAAKETEHPELAVAPMVGWLGQNGAPLCNDLFQRAPDRVIAWADAWYQAWPKYPELIKAVPVASAWEFDAKYQAQRQSDRENNLPLVANKATPAPDLRCYASTYGFPHGIYSKFSFFVMFLDRCIVARLPTDVPRPGEPTELRLAVKETGWCGDFNEVGQWNAIAPYGDARSMVSPQWMPDEYMAWAWRAYHSAKPDVKLTSPIVEYHRGGDRTACGMGFAPPTAVGTALKFEAETALACVRVEFHDGNQIVGVAEKLPWKVEGVKLG